MPLAEFKQKRHKLEKISVAVVQLPVHPIEFIVLAIGVVVTALSSAQLVPRQHHGNTLRQQQRDHEVATLLSA